MQPSLHRSPRAVALIIVIALVAMMTLLAVTFFVAVSGENRASQHQSESLQAQQLAYSAAQMVMSQIKTASSLTPSGTGDAVAWTSQPGLLRTFTPAGASTVYKLYSAQSMVTGTFAETDDAPPIDWKSSPALYCDINAPISITGSSSILAYPVADPTTTAASFSGTSVVPGYAREASVTPGFDPTTSASPTNNPLPMPVRWLYILKDGQIAIPASAAADGTVTFAPAPSPQPTSTNPVVGRIAFWADDETCKVNINTAGYARNDTNYWSYWDTPIGNTQDENKWLSWNQPWTNEFQRYPGHPATTGLNVVFDSLNLTDVQTLSLTPKYKAGGTLGGTVSGTSAPTAAQVAALLKDERIYPTLDEMFYNPTSGTNTVGIAAQDLEVRRFLLTAVSRAPETTLFDTPRVTIWPTWQTTSKRTPMDSLIAFCSTIAPNSTASQPFYFVRENPLATTELNGIPQNLTLWNYLQTISGRSVPGFGGNFGDKYGTKTRDQILTSIFDAIRLANLDDRSAPAVGSTTTGYSFTSGTLSFASGTGIPVSTNYTEGYVAPTDGPNGTRGAGRTPALAEVAFLFARTGSNALNTANDPATGSKYMDEVKVAVLYGSYAQAAGFVEPGFNRRIKVTGLSSFTVSQALAQGGSAQQIFANDVFDRTENDGNNSSLRELGGRLSWFISQMPPTRITAMGGPPTGNVVLPYDAANPNNNTFSFSGGTLNIQIYSPSTATTPYQTFQITFPPAAAVLTPLPVSPATTGTLAFWTPGGRWATSIQTIDVGRMAWAGDTVLAMQNRTGDFRSEVLRSGTITDFQPHYRYGKTDIIPYTLTTTTPTSPVTSDQLSRWASSMKFCPDLSYATAVLNLGANSDLYDQLFGRLITGFNGYCFRIAPVIPSCYYPQAIQDQFPPGDFSNGPGTAGDGSLSPKTDEGGEVTPSVYDESPYFRDNFVQFRYIAQGTLSSPNRQMPSAVLFGSIPSGTGDLSQPPTAPWQTLLFRPARAYHMGGTTHFGGASHPPCDYFMLDWFHMPVVEPYAISEPFSTAGKINLNARIIPFGNYIRRETALHALLRSARVVAVSESVVGQTTYAADYNVSQSPTSPTRYPIDTEETLNLLRARFDGSDGSGKNVYLTNGEICSVDLVPQGYTGATLASFWADKRVTGDNSREQPYSLLEPRLTTRSNTFTVHVTAQVITPGPNQFGWREVKDRVHSEWRGQLTVERYVDPNDTRFTGSGAPNFLSGTQPLGSYYRFRVLDTRRFDP